MIRSWIRDAFLWVAQFDFRVWQIILFQTVAEKISSISSHFLIYFILFLSPSSSQYLVPNSLLCSSYNWNFTREFPHKLNCSARKTRWKQMCLFQIDIPCNKADDCILSTLLSSLQKSILLSIFWIVAVLLRYYTSGSPSCWHRRLCSFHLFHQFLLCQEELLQVNVIYDTYKPSPLLPLCTYPAQIACSVHLCEHL